MKLLCATVEIERAKVQQFFAPGELVGLFPDTGTKLIVRHGSDNDSLVLEIMGYTVDGKDVLATLEAFEML